jgi:putative phosphotransacetylase
MNSDYDKIVEIISKSIKEVLSEKKIYELSYSNFEIPVGVSVRHIHLTQDVLDILYGKGYTLTKMRDLNQPGEFAACETVTLVGPKMRCIPNVRILGPLREITQVELSKTDGIILGIELQTRLSGDIKGSSSITLVGPKGSLFLKEGAIRAQRHIHMTPKDAERFGVSDRQPVSVEVLSDNKVTFHNVIVRVNEKYALEFHIDADEANAADVETGMFCKIIK